MPDITKVILILEPSRGFDRELMKGISRYSRLLGRWNFHIWSVDDDRFESDIRCWGGTGIIARISNDRVAQAILRVDVPTIALGLADDQFRSSNPLSRLSVIGSDPAEVSRVAADHLFCRGCKYYAYVGDKNLPWSRRREREYCRILGVRGIQPFRYNPSAEPVTGVRQEEKDHLTQWLRELPKPVGVFACDDERGGKVLEACTLAQLLVPEDVSVLGVDNDEVLCSLSLPPLSSISLNVRTAGFRAAELLDVLMKRRIHKPQRILVDTLGVVTRRSTDSDAVGDEIVAKAVQRTVQIVDRMHARAD